MYLNLLALRMEDSRLEASSRAMMAAMEKSVAEPAALLLAVVVVCPLAFGAAGAAGTPLHKYGWDPTSILKGMMLFLMGL